MMKKPSLSAKRIQIDKSNARLIITVAVSIFVTIFCIVAIRALYSQLSYQSRVINAKERTLKQVKENNQKVAELNTAYQEFIGQPTNALGGNPTGSGDRDGENARIVLDALPSKYDFPAMATSVDKLLRSGGFKPNSILGIDDEVNQSANKNAVNPEVVEMPFSVEADIGLGDSKRFMELFELSIRPIDIQKVGVGVNSGNLTIKVEAKTYFMPEKKLNITDEVVR